MTIETPELRRIKLVDRRVSTSAGVVFLGTGDSAENPTARAGDDLFSLTIGPFSMEDLKSGITVFRNKEPWGTLKTVPHAWWAPKRTLAFEVPDELRWLLTSRFLGEQMLDDAHGRVILRRRGFVLWETEELNTGLSHQHAAAALLLSNPYVWIHTRRLFRYLEVF